MDHLAWIQSTNIYDFQYYAFGERVRNLDMFTGADTLCPLVEINEVMQQAQEMGEFGRIDNSRYLMKASPLIEHIYISAFPPYRQDQIRTATLHEVKNRPEVLWDARRRFPPRFSTEQDEHNVYITICTDSDHDADAAYAQRLQNAIDEKDSVVYSKRKLQLQEDAAYAQSLAAADADNNRKTRANTTQQQMSSVNNRENLQMMLDIVTPLEEIPDNEEDDDDQPMELAQLEQLEEIIHGQPYQPGQYSQANITFHGSEPEGSPAEMHGEDSEWLTASDRTAAFAARSDKCKEWKVNRPCIDKPSLQQHTDTLKLAEISAVNKPSQAYKLFSGKLNKWRNNFNISDYKNNKSSSIIDNKYKFTVSGGKYILL